LEESKNDVNDVGNLEESKNDSNDVGDLEESKHDSNDVGGYLFQFTPTFKLGESPTLSLQDLFSGLRVLKRRLLSDAEETEVNNTLEKCDQIRAFWAKEAGLQEQEVDITNAIIRPFKAVFK
jgi:hypothetical protein